MDQLRDKILCTSPLMTLCLRLCSHLLVCWKPGMQLHVELVNTNILFFFYLSVRIKFSMFIFRNNPRQIIPLYPN